MKTSAASTKVEEDVRPKSDIKYIRDNPYLHSFVLIIVAFVGIGVGSHLVFEAMWTGDKSLSVKLPPAYFNLLAEYEKRMQIRIQS